VVKIGGMLDVEGRMARMEEGGEARMEGDVGCRGENGEDGGGGGLE